MHVISYSALRKELASTLDKVNNDHAPILITRQNGKPAVLMSLDDYNAYQETSYLLSSPKNAQRLKESIAQAETGLTTPHELIEQ